MSAEQDVGMVAQVARTGVEIVIRSEDFLAVLLEQRLTETEKMLLEYEQQLGGEVETVAIPREKLPELMELGLKYDVPFEVVDPDKGLYSSSDVEKIDEAGNYIGGSKYVEIRYRGGIVMRDELGVSETEDIEVPDVPPKWDPETKSYKPETIKRPETTDNLIDAVIMQYYSKTWLNEAKEKEENRGRDTKENETSFTVSEEVAAKVNKGNQIKDQHSEVTSCGEEIKETNIDVDIENSDGER